MPPTPQVWSKKVLTGKARVGIATLGSTMFARPVPYLVIEVEEMQEEVTRGERTGRYRTSWRPARPIDLGSKALRENPIFTSYFDTTKEGV